jgi:hypothetical protein
MFGVIFLEHLGARLQLRQSRNGSTASRLKSQRTKRLAASTVSIRQALNYELGLELAKRRVPEL